MKSKKSVEKSNRSVSVIVIAKNEEKMLPDCLTSVKWADEIVVVDTGSTDSTVAIAKKFGARVIDYSHGSFSDWRNKGLETAMGEWVLYVDADERVTKELREEVLGIVSSQVVDGDVAYAIPRRNFIFGREMKYSGQWPDYQMRFFKKKYLKGYKNDLHEVAEFNGRQGYLNAPFLHIKHDNLGDMVEKTNKWSVIEAKLLFETGHPKMSWWRFFRIMGTELWYRLITLRGFMDGPEGVIYAIYQMWSRFLTYAKLWEMQLGKSDEKYKNKELTSL